MLLSKFIDMSVHYYIRAYNKLLYRIGKLGLRPKNKKMNTYSYARINNSKWERSEVHVVRGTM